MHGCENLHDSSVNVQLKKHHWKLNHPSVHTTVQGTPLINCVTPPYAEQFLWIASERVNVPPKLQKDSKCFIKSQNLEIFLFSLPFCFHFIQQSAVKTMSYSLFSGADGAVIVCLLSFSFSVLSSLHSPLQAEESSEWTASRRPREPHEWSKLGCYIRTHKLVFLRGLQ